MIWNARRQLARIVTAILVTASAAVLLPAQPANALVVPIPMGVTIGNRPNDIAATEFEICGWGRATSAVNQWEMRVVGVRVPELLAAGTERSELGEPINELVTSTGRDFDACVTVPFGATVGAVFVSLTYIGLGPDVTGAVFGEGTWAAGESGGTGIVLGGPPVP